PARRRNDREEQPEQAEFGHACSASLVVAVRGQGNHRGVGGIDALTQLLAGLEMGYVLARQGHRLAGLGVAAHARGPVMQREAAETTSLESVAVVQLS